MRLENGLAIYHIKVQLTGKQADGYVIPLGTVNLVNIVTDVGMVGCGAYDVAALNNFGYPAAKVRPSQGCSIATIEDLLQGIVKEVNHYHRALQIVESLYGPDNLDAAVILTNLVETAKAQSEPAEAREFFARALGIFRNNLGPDHPYATTVEEHLETLPQTQLPLENVDDDYDYGFYF